jgi:hypothetical protein
MKFQRSMISTVPLSLFCFLSKLKHFALATATWQPCSLAVDGAVGREYHLHMFKKGESE